MAVVILHEHKYKYLGNLIRECYMRSMWKQLGNLGTISAFASRHRETKKNLCRGGKTCVEVGNLCRGLQYCTAICRLHVQSPMNVSVVLLYSLLYSCQAVVSNGSMSGE